MAHRRYIHNFRNLCGAARIYDGDRAGGALKILGVGTRDPRIHDGGTSYGGKGKGELAKSPTGVVRYFALRLPRRSAQSRHPV